MKIGFDVDGVLANFIPAYQRLIIELTGKNLFHPDDDKNPPCWDWPQHRGYTNEEVGLAWKSIAADNTFWMSLTPHRDGVGTLRMVYPDLFLRHDLYFITARVGDRAKHQTELWLQAYVAPNLKTPPTVLISADKGGLCRALRLDAYLDDNLDNVNACVSVVRMEADRAQLANEKPKFATRVYLLDKSYNSFEAAGPMDLNVRRVNTVGQMLDYEMLQL